MGTRGVGRYIAGWIASSRINRRRAFQEDVTLSEIPAPAVARAIGARDIPLVFVAPRRLFARAEDVGAYAWPLVILLTAVTLLGAATVQTGLIELEVRRGVDARIAALDSEQRDVVERSALREMYAQQRKMGEFWELLTNIKVVAAEPLKALANVLLVAAVLYGVVALTGRKTEWHTLLTICVFAGFIDLLRLITVLGLMLSFRTLDVDTSAALLAPMLTGSEGVAPQQTAAVAGLLTAVDPFRIWYWLVILIGLSATAQLRGWRAWSVCVLCWLIGAGTRAGLAAAAAASMAPASASPGA